jgi:hydrogenase-4 component B
MIQSALLILAWLTPLMLVPLFLLAPHRAWKAMPMAALPGLAASLLVPAGSMVEIHSLLLGSRFGLDQIGAGFLFFTSLIWALAALHAIGYIRMRHRSFGVYYLLAMTGNFGLVLAQDMISFYLFFALMSFASYGLVIHDRTTEVRRAGTVYIILVVLGEVLIFSGMAGIATIAGTTIFGEIGGEWVTPGMGNVLFGALLLGFGIKAGALPLHVWLPLAHPAAPTPASAVLSGAMIKAGLLGWLRFLPMGEMALPGWGALCTGFGAAALIAAAVYGCFQSQPKALLAYSSISKMGLMTMAVGTVFLYPDFKEAILITILVYATHHALCKGALFLSVGIRPGDSAPGPRRWLVILLLLIPPLSLADFALTGGALAKYAIKTELAAVISPAAYTNLSLLFTASGLITAALMVRFTWQQLNTAHRPHHTPGRTSYLAWGTLTGVVALTPLLLPALYPDSGLSFAMSGASRWSSVWPVALAVGIGAVYVRSVHAVISLPPGDILSVFLLLTRPLRVLPKRIVRLATAIRNQCARCIDLAFNSMHNLPILLRHSEANLGRAAVFGLVFLGLLTLTTILLFLSMGVR